MGSSTADRDERAVVVESDVVADAIATAAENDASRVSMESVYEPKKVVDDDDDVAVCSLHHCRRRHWSDVHCCCRRRRRLPRHHRPRSNRSVARECRHYPVH